jgi:hypothetical protein
MFRHFATLVSPDTLFKAHPAELAWLLEEAWRQRFDNKNKALGDPDRRSSLSASPDDAPLPLELSNILRVNSDNDGSDRKFRWDHLIYAYMIENTRLYEVFKRVVHEFVHGEKLGVPDADSQAWLRNTEELFFKDGAPFFATSLLSHIRGDLRGNRRNPYQRMFGMELNHGMDDGKPQPYVRAESANAEFVPTFEELLREVWIGMTYVKPGASSDPTDTAKILTLISKLKNMLLSRRQDGNLAREEFSAVTAMSWFHLTLEYKNDGASSPIIASLRAQASGTEQRLFKVAERVGLPAHGLSKHYFDMADAISRILTQIESNDYDTADKVRALFTPEETLLASPEAAMRTIITHWTAITGRDVKARKVAPN